MCGVFATSRQFPHELIIGVVQNDILGFVPKINIFSYHLLRRVGFNQSDPTPISEAFLYCDISAPGVLEQLGECIFQGQTLQPMIMPE